MHTKPSVSCRFDQVFRPLRAGVSLLLLCGLMAGTGCGGPDMTVTPQTMRRVQELLDSYEQARQAYVESDFPGGAEQPDPARLQEALNLLESPAGRKADPRERQSLLIRVQMLNEDWDLAAEALEERIKEEVDQAALWRDLALCRLKMGPVGWPGAEEAARKSLTLEPESAEGWWLAGKAAQVLEWQEEARARFARAVEKDPGYLPARLEQTVEAVSGGGFARAAEVLRDAGKKARPYDIMLRLEFRRALAEAEKAGTAIPVSPDQYAPAAWIYYQAARYEDAIRWAREAMETQPDDFEILGLLTLTLTLVGRGEEGIDTCQRFLDAHPGHEGATALLNQLRQAAAVGGRPSAAAAPTSPGTPGS